MIRTRSRLIWMLAAGLGLATAAAADPPTLQPNALEPLPLGAIRPSGWLKVQLETQAKGLGGGLDEFWPDIRDSAWIGGKAEGWERVPYWLDGIVPLAYLLDDPALKAKAKRYVDYILDHQQPDGWLGPIGDAQKHTPYDVWPLFPLYKALLQYEQATGDPRVIPALVRCARKIDQVVDETPIYEWAKVRAADYAVALYALYDRTKEPFLIEAARKIMAQGHDWRAQFEDYRLTDRQTSGFGMLSHGVNTGMGWKFGPARSRLTGDAGDRDAVFQMLGVLDRCHGQANGMFTCDEHVAGRSPSQGTELCTVVEAMYSLETAIATLGDARLGDRLERIAYNALPATFKKDMTAHQYDQQANQVVCSREGDHVYATNGPDSNLFGLEPNFGCCTANFHQGWPKLAAHLWMKTPKGGLAVAAYAPCVVTTEIQGKPVRVEVKTAYPFRDAVEIVVTVPEPMRFPLELRVPEWSRTPSITMSEVPFALGGRKLRVGDAADVARDERSACYRTLDAEWSGTKTVRLELPAFAQAYRGYNGSTAILRGPLLFALPIAAEWKKVKDNPKFADWEVLPKAAWNYALELSPGRIEDFVTFREVQPAVDAPAFSAGGASVQAEVRGRRLEGWGIDRGAAAPPPKSPVSSPAPLETLKLIPYGCTDLRVAEFPTLLD
ncbi:beta-L-arabinofuranosidase domain-containing protein [Paludisphaera mucosa]|uniref:Glycoside hydrolase family 127 protein n=1 Tax=Paludisphaera mucosa TaxID=3030827 RepID=A0ABT6FAF6_9BACT|nr:beta-L-arabinofuranosidase domain-containing protein [Paludisphaera mucosa]MDG3004578.1 glycoside hydrolase family 127 protein [Paludisphaera mucosa]